MTGRVSLVGAGPGDPGLLTRRAVARLRAADLVLFDALIDARVLELARHAQRFFVGKRAGRPALSQRDIQALMIRAARRGRKVVRLKGGDPFVYGRGGEEAVALAAAGISFEVVPGVSSVLAAPALAGIPVTHRGLSSSVFVTSGHDVDAFREATAGLRPNAVTLVIAMGWAHRAALAETLIGAGWPDTAPAAIVANASMAGARTWRGTLGELARGGWGGPGDRAQVPALVIVGHVAALALVSPRSAARSAVAPRAATRVGRARRRTAITDSPDASIERVRNGSD